MSRDLGVLKLKVPDVSPKKIDTRKINGNCVLFPQIKLILFTLHLLYEDLKLNNLRAEDLKLLVGLLSQLASDLGLDDYCLIYWKDFPEICPSITGKNIISDADLKNIISHPVFESFDIMGFISNLIDSKKEVVPYPWIRGVTNRSRDVIEVFFFWFYTSTI